MKVLHISTADKQGGAAIAAYRLHVAMLASAIDSRMLVLNKVTDDETVTDLSRVKRKILWPVKFCVEKFLFRKPNKHIGRYSFFKLGFDVSRHILVKQADVIYLHWINRNFLDIRAVEKILKLGKPVFWFMHDMFPITGGCHHSFECSKYQTGCKSCQYFDQKFLPDNSGWLFHKKFRIFNHYENLKFIAPSVWLYNCALSTILVDKRRVYYIPNLIDVSLFKILDRNVCRFLFNIPKDKKVILFGADSALSNPYKGFRYLKESLEILYKNNYMIKDIILVVFGSGYRDEIASQLPYETMFVGKLNDEFSLAALYNCADVFVIPSLAEAFGQTCLESLACNVPVVGFDIGGIPDMINESTGYLAKYRNSEDLANGIKVVLDSHTPYKTIDFVRNDFSSEVIVKKHKEILRKK